MGLRLRLVIRWVLVTTALTAALLAGLEGALRIAGLHFPALRQGDRSQDLWVFDATKGWFHRRSFETELPLGGPDRGRIRTNSLGLRGPEVSARKPEGVRRVLLVGDSYVFGHGVDDEHTLSVRLSERLNARGAARYEVINLGVNSYSTDQQLILFEEMAPNLAPDLVVHFACDNDFEANTQDFVNQRYYKPYYVASDHQPLARRNVPVPQFTRGQRLKLWLGQNSEVWNAVRSRRSHFPWVNAALARFQVATPIPPRSPAIPLTAALIVALRDAAQGLGSEFVTLNTGHRGEQVELLQKLRPLLRREGIRMLGLEGNLGDARKRNPSGLWDFPGDAHWNVAAVDLVAEVTYNFLEASRLLGEPPGDRMESKAVARSSPQRSRSR